METAFEGPRAGGDASAKENILKQPETREVLSDELSYIARTVAKDFRVSVYVGKEDEISAANKEAWSIILNPLDIKTKGRFIAGHEGAHLSDTPSFEQLGLDKAAVDELAKKHGFFVLKNLIEDFAINDRMVRDFPKLVDDALAAYERHGGRDLGYSFVAHPEVLTAIKVLGFIPRYARALAALLSDWSELRHKLGFNRTAEEYANEPYAGMKVSDPEIAKFLRIALAPTRKATSMIYAAEDANDGEKILLAGKKRYFWCKEVIYPALAELVEEDLKQYREQDQQDSGSESGNSSLSEEEKKRVAREALGKFDDVLRDLLKSLWEKDGDAPSTEEAVRKEGDIEREREAKREEEKAFRRSGKRLREEAVRQLTPYQQFYQEVADRIDEAYGRLIDIFMPNKHFKLERHQRTGPLIDMQEAIHFEATGDGLERLFMRRIRPKRLNIDIAVIIDRSGSMNGHKIKHAVKAAIFTKELFERLEIGCACIAFSDSPEKLVDFDAGMQEESEQQALMQGLDANGNTHDNQALLYTESQLIQRSSRSKAIVMISDAESSEDKQLPKTVKLLEEQRIPVLHFGIGPGTVDVHGNYQRSFGGLTLSGSDNKNFFDVFSAQMERLAEELL
ncbi:MAG: VWA domain-containing protein [Deltaproteobacteria bacterium]|nr:VWA domain-containing protein [Deltaproteobacteria bacterium]